MRNYILVDDVPQAVDDILVWARWMEEAQKDGRFRVDETNIGDVRVSTVFLGIDHDFVTLECKTMSEAAQRAQAIRDEANAHSHHGEKTTFHLVEVTSKVKVQK